MTPTPPDPLDDADDDAALHWAGDEARGQAAPRLREATPASGTASEAHEVASAPARPPAERALRVGTGVFAVLMLAETVGWILSAQLLIYPAFDLLGEIMWQFGEFLAMIAAALWFAAAVTLTPAGTRSRGLKRMLALFVGVIVLVPWPALLYWIGSMQ